MFRSGAIEEPTGTMAKTGRRPTWVPTVWAAGLLAAAATAAEPALLPPSGGGAGPRVMTPPVPPLFAAVRRLAADPPQPAIAPAGLLTVGGVPVAADALGGCPTCGPDGCRGSTACIPGRPCGTPGCGGGDDPPPDTAFGRLAAAVRDGVCCPDPCYQPKWTSLANAAFFADSPRPATVTRVRWDEQAVIARPDRGTFLLGRSDGRGRGLRPLPGRRSPGRISTSELILVTESGTDRFVATFELPYRSVRADAAGAGAGFGDLVIGTKALLFDSQRFQLAYTFRTFLTTGNSVKGLGTGHVSLEPGVLVGVLLSADTALQAQVAERAVVGGEPGYSGGVLHYHLSVNRVLVRPAADVQLIGTLELNGWTFHSGSFTDPVFGPTGTAEVSILSLGPGLRLAFCDKFDFGLGTAFAITDPRLAKFQSRFEVRYRY